MTIPITASAISSSAATALTAIVARRQGRMRSCACSIARTEFGLRAAPPASGTCLGTVPGHVPDPGPRVGEPVVERAPRLPAELALCAGGVEDAALQLSRPRVDELG